MVSDKATAQTALLMVGVGLAAWDMAAGVLISLIWLVPIIVAIDLGASRERKGWMWGLCLGWLGVFILALMRARPRTSLS